MGTVGGIVGIFATAYLPLGWLVTYILTFVLAAIPYGVVVLIALAAVIAAPVVEECIKPLGVVLILATRPWLLRNRLHIAALCALAGVTFGYLESLVYIYVYVRDHTEAFVWFRLTITPALHAVASFTFGLGLDRRIIKWAEGERTLRQTGWRFMAGAMVIHGAYNLTALVLEALDVFEFQD